MIQQETSRSLRIFYPLARLPGYAYAGLVLNVAAWACSWSRIGPYDYTFFPLWMGFILFLDGLNSARTNTSLLQRGPRRFVALFFYSIPAWWTFEGLNSPVQNWHYRFDQSLNGLQYNVLSSIAFSTVLPAVMEMAELIASFAPFKPRVAPQTLGKRLANWQLVGLEIIGLVLLILPIVEPRYFFALIWVCLIFIFDPVSNKFGRKSLFGRAADGNWRLICTLALATLCCGFFWEMWNSRAMPNWYYTIPFVNSELHLFAMPWPGYAGYLPFGLELFAMYQVGLLITRRQDDKLAL